MTVVLIRSSCLVLASLPDLGLESTLDGINRPPGAAGLARHEEYTILLGQKSVRRFARFACHVFDYGGG